MINIKRYFWLLFLLSATITLKVNAQTEKKSHQKKHVQIIIVEDGKKQVIDTLIPEAELDQFFRNMDFNVDSLLHDAKIRQQEAMKKLKEQMKEFKGDLKEWMQKLNDYDFDWDDLCDTSRHSFPPKNFYFQFPSQKQSDRYIDLNDPSIISFERKKMDGNKEKITIIRKIPAEEQE